MLILTVKENELLVLTQDGVELGRISVEIKRDGRARVGMDFPRDIKILRAELLDRIAKEAGHEG